VLRHKLLAISVQWSLNKRRADTGHERNYSKCFRGVAPEGAWVTSESCLGVDSSNHSPVKNVEYSLHLKDVEEPFTAGQLGYICTLPYMSGAAARLAFRDGNEVSPRDRRWTLLAVITRHEHSEALEGMRCLLMGGGLIRVKLTFPLA
jgi:hypothetical protein